MKALLHEETSREVSSVWILVKSRRVPCFTAGFREMLRTRRRSPGTHAISCKTLSDKQVSSKKSSLILALLADRNFITAL